MLRSVSGSNSSRGIAAVVGVGPRLGSAVARKFASEGYTIAILSRDLGTEAVAAGGGDRAGGQGAGVRAPGGLRRRPLRARGLRGRPLPRPRRGARLQRLRAAGGQRRRRRGRAPHALPRRHPRCFPPCSRRLRRRGLPLRATGHPGHGGEGQGHHHLHGLLGVGHRLRRLLRSKLRQVCPPGVVPVAGQGVPAGRRAHCACDHRRRHRREEVAEEQQGRQRRRRGGRGPGRGGAELLARPRPGQERVDARDGHPVAVLHVAPPAAAASPLRPGRRTGSSSSSPCTLHSSLDCYGRSRSSRGRTTAGLVVMLCTTSYPSCRVCARPRAGNRVPVPRRSDCLAS